MKTKLLLVLLPAFAITAAAAPPGWKATLSDDKKCEAMVPGSWHTAVTGEGMQISGGRSHVSVVLDEGSLPDKKTAMAFLYHVTKTFEDSAARYWVETAETGTGMRQWIVATPASGGVCSATIRFDKMVSEADARTIAASVKKH